MDELSIEEEAMSVMSLMSGEEGPAQNKVPEKKVRKKATVMMEVMTKPRMMVAMLCSMTFQ